MTQDDDPDHKGTTPAPFQRPPRVIALTALCVFAAISASGLLVTRFLLTQWPLWASVFAGFLLAFVLVGACLVALGRSAGHLITASLAILCLVALLWSQPAKLAAEQRHSPRAESHRPISRK